MLSGPKVLRSMDRSMGRMRAPLRGRLESNPTESSNGMLSEPLRYGALRCIARDASQFPDCGYVFATGRGGPALLKQRAVAAGQYFRLTDEAPGARVLSTTTLRRGFPRRLGHH